MSPFVHPATPQAPGIAGVSAVSCAKLTPFTGVVMSVVFDVATLYVYQRPLSKYATYLSSGESVACPLMCSLMSFATPVCPSMM